MRTRLLGTTGVRIPAIAQGCGTNRRFSAEEITHHSRTIRAGIEQGLVFLDTAEIYGHGSSEEMVAHATVGIRERVFIATKVSPEHLDYSGVLEAAHRSLARLRTSYIDLYQVHWPNPSIPVEETMRAMRALIESGKVRFCGLSNFSVQGMKEAARAVGMPIPSNQAEYNLIDRSAEADLLPFCEANKMTFLAYSPLARHKIPEGHPGAALLRNIATRHDRTTAEIVLAWLCSRPSVVPIVRSFTPANMERNVEAASLELDPSDVAAIAKVFDNPVMLLEPGTIRVEQIPEEGRRFYETVAEALSNPCRYSPSPSELAATLEQGDTLKPIKVVESESGYSLVEGQVRYWAHVIAFGERKPIRACLRLR